MLHEDFSRDTSTENPGIQPGIVSAGFSARAFFLAVTSPRPSLSPHRVFAQKIDAVVFAPEVAIVNSVCITFEFASIALSSSSARKCFRSVFAVAPITRPMSSCVIPIPAIVRTCSRFSSVTS